MFIAKLVALIYCLTEGFKLIARYLYRSLAACANYSKWLVMEIEISWLLLSAEKFDMLLLHTFEFIDS